MEPRRHAAGLPDLTEPEAQAAGSWYTRVSRALRDVGGADQVYAAVPGNGVPHPHVHLLARYPGTPPEFWGLNADEWPGCGTRHYPADRRPRHPPPRVPLPASGSQPQV